VACHVLRSETLCVRIDPIWRKDLRKLNHLIHLLALGTLVLLGHPDTARAQLLFNPLNQVTLNIGGPGQTATAPTITVTSTTTPVTSLSISNVVTSDGTLWLCPSAIGSTISVSVGSGCGTITTQLSVNTTYNGSFMVTANGNQTGTVSVTLIVGSSGSTTNGLTTIPSQLSFSQSFAGQSVSSQTATAYFNNATTNINNVSFTPISGPNGAVSFASCFSSGPSVTCSLTGNASTQGSYSGTATLSTASGGTIGLPVSLTIGTGGSTSGLSVSQNPVNLFASTTGAAVSTQFVTVSENGSQVQPQSVNYSTSTGGSWLQAFVSGNTVAVAGNSFNLGIGTYTGTVTVNTTFGSTTFNANLSVGTSGGTSGLTVNPNPVTLFASSAGAAVTTQFASILFNGTQVTPQSVTFTTNNGGNWLTAFISGNSVAVGAFSNNLGIGTYNGTVTVGTIDGTTSFPVTLNVGTNGTGTAGLTVSQNPVTLSTSVVGGAVSPQSVSVLYNGTQITPSSVSTSTTTGASWLQASIVGSAVQVSANTSFVGVGSYSGTVTVQTVYGPTSFTVNLNVGTNGVNSSGLVANPSTVNFTIPFGGGTSAQNVTISFNGVAVSISSVTSNTNSTQNWLIVNPTSSGVMMSINGAALQQGTYNATVTVNTTSGSLNIPVNLTVGTGGGSTNGLTATPNPVTLSTLQAGGAVSPQTVSITFNGAAANVSNVTTSTTTGQNWLSASVVGSNLVSVNANTSVLSTGTYTGTVFVTTTFGTATFTVNLTIGATSANGLNASPNPVTLTTASAGSVVQSQNVGIFFNGLPASITGISTSTTTSQNWLVASSQGSSVSVTANTANLATGTYSGTVTVTTTQGTTSFSVNLTVGTGLGGSTSALQASPNPVTFVQSTGSQGGSQTVTLTFNGGIVPVTNATFSPTDLFTSFVNVVLNSNGTVTLNLNNIATNPGTYTGQLLLYSTFGQLSVPVTLTIGGGGTTVGLGGTPNPVNFNIPVGGATQTQTVSITNSGSAVGVTSVSASTTTGQAWLIPSIQSSAVSVSANPSGLLAGTYSGTVNVTTTLGLVTIQVNLTVGGSGTTTPTGLTLAPSSLLFAYQLGQTLPAAQSVSVSSSNGQFSFNASPGSGSFLTVSQGQGNTPGTFSVSVNTAGLGVGTYNGSISVTSAASSAPQTIPVTLVVSSTSLFQLSASAVTLSSPAGSTTPVSQNVQVTSTDNQPISFSTVASSTSNWLTVSSSTQTTPSTITITANPVGLAQGTYTGSVTLTSTNLTNVLDSPFTIPVTLIVGAGGGTGALSSSPTSLSFSQAPNGAAPATQSLSITGPAGSTFTANVNLQFGQNWLTVSPTSFSAPTTLIVSANGSNLAVGTYSGTIVISGSGGSLSIPVSLAVGSSSTLPSVTVSPASLAPVSFQTGGPNPAAQTIQLSLSNGSATTFNASASATTGGAWLSVSPTSGTTPANIVVSVNPTGLAAGTYTGSVSISVPGASNSPLNLPITLTVTAAATTPTVVAIQNAASSIPTSLSPGLNVTIFGTNMGPATLTTLQLTPGGSVATTLSGTQVTFDGVPAPVIYTKNTQVSVMVPYEVAGKTSTSMVVSYNGVSSTPLQLRVVDTAPGLYTINQSGSGQAAILNQNGTVNSPQNPDVVGDILQIFLTGEGQISPAGVDGAITPGRAPFPTPVGPVSVQIGGVPVPATDITYAGEAPGLISGVLQVNAKIPPGAGSGPVSIVVSVGGVQSQPNVTVSVR
jgi:uncharacterized protein (TIGR03437 family)